MQKQKLFMNILVMPTYAWFLQPFQWNTYSNNRSYAFEVKHIDRTANYIIYMPKFSKVTRNFGAQTKKPRVCLVCAHCCLLYGLGAQQLVMAISCESSMTHGA